MLKNKQISLFVFGFVIDSIIRICFLSLGSGSIGQGQGPSIGKGVSVDEVTRGDSVSVVTVVINQAGGESVGHGRNGGIGSRIGQRYCEGHRSDRVNKSILVIVIRESLKMDIL